MSFPGAIASFLGFTSSHTLAADSHAAQHNSEQTEIVATQTKIGTGSSTPTSGLLLRGTGAGTSSWAQANLTSDVTGVLPQANGGTGTTLATGTGKAVYDTSPTISGAQLTSSPSITTPTITTPTIADFTNANHNHQNTAGGGKLTATAISSLDLTSTTLKNPYKFRVSMNGATNTGNGAFAVVPFDTKQYDTSTNVASGVFTAPVAGFYQFNWQTTATLSSGAAEILVASLFVNGTRTSDSSQPNALNANAVHGSDLISLSANDTVDIRAFAPVTRALVVGNINGNYFSGYLMSNT